MAETDFARAVYKALDRAPLTLNELSELTQAGAFDLFEFGLRHDEVRRVQNHAQHETQRHTYQVQYHKLGPDGTRSDLMENKSKIRIGKRQLKRIIQEEVEYAHAQRRLRTKRRRR
jgi:hypothetical protein